MVLDPLRSFFFLIYEQYKRQGYGKRSLTFFEQQAKANGCNQTALVVFKDNTPVLSLYKSNDYAIEKETAIEEGDTPTQYKMVKKL